MSTISPTEVKRLAQLGRLQLTDEEVQRATKNLDDIFNHFSQIQQIDTTGALPADDVTGMHNQTRADEPASEVLCSHESLLAAAPARWGDYIKVPAVFE